MVYPGPGPYYPPIPVLSMNPSIAANLIIDATGEKAAMCGRVWYEGATASKNISRVHFRFGAVTKAGGSALTISLQDISETVGPPTQPDGVQDQTVAVANADAAFAANTWYRSGALSANRTVAKGDKLAVVVEFDGAGRLGADTVSIAGFNAGSTIQFPANHHGVSVLLTASWAAIAQLINVVLEFDDGSFGTLEGSQPVSALFSAGINVNTAVADEYAVGFQVPYACKIDGLWAIANPVSNAEFELILYAGTTALATVPVDANSIPSASGRTIYVPIPEQTLTPGTSYYVSVRPTTTNTVTLYGTEVNDPNHMALLPGGSSFLTYSRVDQGAWSAANTTRRMFAGIRLTDVFF